MRSNDWKHTAIKLLKNRRICLHTDGARAYGLKVGGMLHDHVAHKKELLKDKNGKPIKRKRKNVWVKPKNVQLFNHRTPDGRRISVKGGTQVIDRAWQHFRKFLVCRGGVGRVSLETRIRSAQFAYWYQGQDLWKKTGEMLTYLNQDA